MCPDANTPMRLPVETDPERRGGVLHGERTRAPRRLLRTVSGALLAVVGLLLCALTYRAVMQRTNEALARIELPAGIIWEGAVDIAGTAQWLEIRGRDRSKPLLLNLHGGPGAALRPLSYVMQRDWEDDFVVANWDQPCGGKTYTLNAGHGCGPMTVARIVRDAIAVADYLRARFGREKIVLLGHSWGSLLGLHVAHQAPERFYAYVGTGQAVSTRRADHVAHQWTLARARQAGDEHALEALQANAGHRRRQYWPWLVKYGGEHWRDRNPELRTLLRALFAPGVTLHELSDWFRGNRTTGVALREEVSRFDAPRDVGLRFGLPIVFVLGEHDFNTPTPLAIEYFHAISAPLKRLVVMREVAHMPMLEDPASFAAVLKAQLAPLIPQHD